MRPPRHHCGCSSQRPASTRLDPCCIDSPCVHMSQLGAPPLLESLVGCCVSVWLCRPVAVPVVLEYAAAAATHPAPLSDIARRSSCSRARSCAALVGLAGLYANLCVPVCGGCPELTVQSRPVLSLRAPVQAVPRNALWLPAACHCVRIRAELCRQLGSAMSARGGRRTFSLPASTLHGHVSVLRRM